MSIQPRRRRPRTAFHYKVDEDLKPPDREPYLALLHDPRTTIDDARRWLLDRGYAPSRSAVARHRRRLLAGEAEQRAAVTRAVAVAQLAAAPNAPDFAAAAEAYWKHLVFERLLVAGAPRLGDPDDLGKDDAPDEPAQLTPRELLDLGRLVAEGLEMTRARARETASPPAAAAAAAQPAPRRSDDELRRELEDILFRGK